MMFLGGVPQRVGYATDGRRWMLTNSTSPDGVSRHQVHYYLDLVKMRSASTNCPSIEIQATSEERSNARTLIAAECIAMDVPFLVLNPGAAYGSAKRWHEDRFANVADILASELGLHVAVIGSKGERSLAEEIRGRMKTRAALLNGKTSLETLIGILAESSLMI